MLLAIVAITITSCNEDFLETKPTDAISAADAFATAENMQLVLNGLHRANLVHTAATLRHSPGSLTEPMNRRFRHFRRQIESGCWPTPHSPCAGRGGSPKRCRRCMRVFEWLRSLASGRMPLSPPPISAKSNCWSATSRPPSPVPPGPSIMLTAAATMSR